jgi:hypothetical protein
MHFVASLAHIHSQPLQLCALTPFHFLSCCKELVSTIWHFGIVAAQLGKDLRAKRQDQGVSQTLFVAVKYVFAKCTEYYRMKKRELY